MALINNGLPEGLHFKDIVPGDLLEIKWEDAPNEIVVVLENERGNKRRDHKGYVSYRVLRNAEARYATTSIEGDQVVRKLRAPIWGLVESYVAAEGNLGK